MVYHALALCAALHVLDICIHLGALLCCGHLVHQFALGRQDEEGDSKHGIGTSGEDGEAHITFCHLDLHLCTFASAYPVPLGLLDGFAPVDGVQSVQQPLAVCTHTQAPLAHLLLFHRVSASFRHAVDHLIVGQHGTQLWAPVDHGLAHECQTIVHQYFALLLGVPAVPLLGGEVHLLSASHVPVGRTFFLEVFYQHLYGHGLLLLVAEEAAKHLLEGPLCPMVVVGCAGTYLTVPVEGEPYLVQLLAVVVDIGKGAYFGVLACLDGMLFGRQSVGIISHGVQYVVSLQALVACIDIACYVSEWMAYVQTSTAGIGEHVQYVELLLSRIFLHLVCVIGHPSLVPFLFNLAEVVFSCHYL